MAESLDDTCKNLEELEATNRKLSEERDKLLADCNLPLHIRVKMQNAKRDEESMRADNLFCQLMRNVMTEKRILQSQQDCLAEYNQVWYDIYTY